MFLVDDILMAPVSGVLWIFQEIYEAAEQERANEADNITLELQKLYRSLESGSISEEDFEARESELLDRLDSIEGIDSDSDDELEDDQQEDQEDEVAETISDVK
jgi:hypothetical protein